MCEQSGKQVLYQEGVYQYGRHGEAQRCHYRPERDCVNSVYVELRRYDFDVILETVVRVDKVKVVDKRVVLDDWSDSPGNIRKAIAEFDKLLENYPMSFPQAAETPLEELPF